MIDRNLRTSLKRPTSKADVIPTGTFTVRRHPESSSGGNERAVSLLVCNGRNMKSGSARKEEGILEVAKGLRISLRWLKGCTFLYWLGLIIWALMFSAVIPGAFYLSIVACLIVTGFVVIDIVFWFTAIHISYNRIK